MLRTSNYLILVPIPDDPTRFLAHHGIRGGCELVTRDEAEYLISLATVRGNAPLHGQWVSDPVHLAAPAASTPSEVRVVALTKRGFLTSWTEVEEEARFMLAVRRVHQKSLAAAMGYNFLFSYEEPARWVANAVDGTIGEDARRTTLRPELIDRICDSLKGFEAELDVTLGEEFPRRVGIVGDHSLRASNRQVVGYLIDRVSALGAAQIWAESTGRELAEFTETIGPAGISKISLIWRGARTHDVGSVRALGRAVELVLGRGAEVLLKLHVTSQIARTLPQIGDLITARGWAGEPRFRLQLLPGEEFPNVFDGESLSDDRTLRQRPIYPEALHPTLRQLTLAEPIRVSPTRSILDAHLDVVSKLISDHRFHAYLFDPQGHLYLSTKEAGDPRLRIGELVERNGAPEIQFVGSACLAPTSPRSAVHKAAAECRRCPYGIHCGWGQAVRAALRTSQRGGNACDEFGARLRSAIAELSQFSTLGEPLSERTPCAPDSSD